MNSEVRSLPDVVPPAEFWQEFVRTHWDRRPSRFRLPSPAALAAPDDVFRALRRAGEQVRAGIRHRSGEPLVTERLYTAERFRLTGREVGDYLPEAADASLAGYAARLKARLCGRKFGLVLNDFQVYDADLWMRARALLRGLMLQLPSQAADMVLFFGDYDATPFGVHQDRRHTFMYVVEGRRRLHLWPDDYFRRPDREHARGTAGYAPYLADAITLEGEPGDLLYWPSSYWHVGECAGGLSTGLAVGLEPFSPRLEAWERISARLRQAVGDADREEPVPDAARGLGEVAAAVEDVTRAALADADLLQELTAELLNHGTGGGFPCVPPPLPTRALEDGDRVRGCADNPVLWSALGGHRLVCSANGHAFSVPASPRTVELLTRLSAGAPLRVGEVTREYAGTHRVDEVEFRATPEAVRSLLETLVSLRALAVERDAQKREPSEDEHAGRTT